jgi:hypothetical protein
VTVFLREIIGVYGVFSSEKVDGTKTRNIFRREFAYLATSDFTLESSGMGATALLPADAVRLGSHGMHGLALRRR